MVLRIGNEVYKRVFVFVGLVGPSQRLLFVWDFYGTKWACWWSFADMFGYLGVKLKLSFILSLGNRNPHVAITRRVSGQKTCRICTDYKACGGLSVQFYLSASFIAPITLLLLDLLLLNPQEKMPAATSEVDLPMKNGLYFSKHVSWEHVRICGVCWLLGRLTLYTNLSPACWELLLMEAPAILQIRVLWKASPSTFERDLRNACSWTMVWGNTSLVLFHLGVTSNPQETCGNVWRQCLVVTTRDEGCYILVYSR